MSETPVLDRVCNDLAAGCPRADMIVVENMRRVLTPDTIAALAREQMNEDEAEQFDLFACSLSFDIPFLGKIVGED